MQSYFTSDFFTKNRQNLRAAIGTDKLIVITGNGVMQRASDEPSPFHQDSNFWYLTGLNGADLTLVMTANEDYILYPTLSFVREAFDGAHDTKQYALTSGITSYCDETEGWKRIKSELQAKPKVATLSSPPPFMKHYGIHTLPYRRRLIAHLKRVQPRLEIQDVRSELATLRCTKQPQELQALQRAIDVTSETLLEIVRSPILAKARYEYELEAEITYDFRNKGSEGHGFSPIVGAGKHSTTLHHIENNGPISKDDLIVLDIGASYEHYSADITRTVSQQTLSNRQAEVFKAVVDVQDYALSLLKPGTMLRDYELAVEQYMGKQLQKLGLISEATHDAIRHYYPHATSHFLGLDTHDVGDYHKPLGENMVVTCEPGIYIPEEGIGVRIEDDVLITANGNKVLSSACPRQVF